MHYSIILNPTAGNGKAQKEWQLIEPQLIQAQASFDIHTTKDRSSAEYFATRLVQRRKKDIVMVIGGDGTLHQVLNGLIKESHRLHTSPLPLAFIPAGINNDFARAFGVPLKPLDALQQILNTTTVTNVNIGHYHEAIKNEEGYFLNNIGVGFDAAIVSRVNGKSARKQSTAFHLWHPGYLRQALGVVYDQQPFQLMVQQGSSRNFYPRAYIVLLVNHPFIGGGVKVAPTSSLSQPQLDLLVAEQKGWPITFWQLIQFSRGKLPNSRFADHLTGPQFHYTTTSLEFEQSDGEPLGNRFVDLRTDVTQYPFWQTTKS